MSLAVNPGGLNRAEGGLTWPELAREYRDRLKDKGYRAYPMGGEAGHYLRWKRGQITQATYRDYEACLDKLSRYFPDLEIADFEPPVGTERLEEFLEIHWGDREPRTYNKNLSTIKDFFKWAVLKGKIHGDPALPVVRHKARDVHRETFNHDTLIRIFTDGPDPDHLFRDRCCLRLLLKYGLRKGALRNIQFKHFDRHRRCLTVFTKGEKIRTLRIKDEGFWKDLARLRRDVDPEDTHYLLPRRKWVFWKYDQNGKALGRFVSYPAEPSGEHGTHNWWYGCLQRAGIVPLGVTAGEKMHKSRHTAGQTLLDNTGNLKAVQKLLGHSDIAVTGNTYTDWDEGQLADSMELVDWTNDL